MTEELLVVSSTNNRAVDNVIDPLCDRSLPIALRAGNQEVTASSTIECLSTARDWLGAEPDQEAKARLDAALDVFRSARSRWQRAIEHERDRRKRSERHAKVL